MLKRIMNEIIKIISKYKNNNDYLYRGETQYFPSISSRAFRRNMSDIKSGKTNVNKIHNQTIINLQNRASIPPNTYYNCGSPYGLLPVRYVEELIQEGTLVTTHFINFSSDILIATFFACFNFNLEDKEQNGRLIVIKRINKIPFYTPSFHPKAIAQKGVYLYPKEGYITNEFIYDIIKIPYWLKKPILMYLYDEHEISCQYLSAGSSSLITPSSCSIMENGYISWGGTMQGREEFLTNTSLSSDGECLIKWFPDKDPVVSPYCY